MVAQMCRKRNPYALLVVNEWVQLLQKTACRFLKILKIKLSYYPAIPPLGISLNKTKSPCHRVICAPMFAEALCAVAKTWKERNCPSTSE